jgi:heptosyltransferase II
MKILIELPSWLGDSVMATPAIENIINYYNKPQVMIIGSFISVEVIKNHPRISRSQVLNKSYLSLYNIAKKLGQFDAFFSFRGSNRSRLFKSFVQSNNKFQYQHGKYQNCHQVEKYNQFVNDSLNTSYETGKLKIHGNLSQSMNKPYPVLGINPGSSYGNAKRWYPEEFAKVAFYLSDKYDILIFGGAGEENIANDIEKILIDKKVLNYKNLAGKTSLSELVNFISNLDLLITGDSGPMHLAASFEIPTVTIFGPTRDDETSQWMNRKSINLKKKLDCQPCMLRKCPLKHHNCMKLIKAEEVLGSVETFQD